MPEPALIFMAPIMLLLLDETNFGDVPERPSDLVCTKRKNVTKYEWQVQLLKHLEHEPHTNT